MNFSRQIALSPQFFALGGTALFYVSSDTRSVVLRRNHLLDDILLPKCSTVDKLTVAKGISSVNFGFYSGNMAKKTDYAALKQKLSEFLSGFATVDDNGRKHFKYAEQLTNLAHR